MPAFSHTKNYQDGVDLTEQQLEDAFGSVEDFLNITKLDSFNIQAGGISSDNIATNAVITSKIASAAVTTSKIADGNVTPPKLSQEARNSFTPTGAILPFAGTSAPDGFLLCDGSEVNRVTYAALFAVIGTAFGAGNGATTFMLPDLRGMFLRGVDGGTGTDPDVLDRTAMAAGGNTGDAVGSVQVDATKMPNAPFDTNETGEHEHGGIRRPGTLWHTTASSSGGAHATHGFVNTTQATGVVAGKHKHTISGGDNETRPKNVAVNYIIKY